MPVKVIHVLPVIVSVLIPSSFLITYCIAVALKHVEAEFPYISDTGTYIPESCIFSQFVNLIAAFLAATMYFRYKLIEQHYRDHLSSESKRVLNINFAAIVIGWIGCLCVSILCNFQETAVVIVHIVASLIAFGCGAIYCWLQTVISYHVCPLLNSATVYRIRCVLSFIVSATFISTLVAGILARKHFHGSDATKWYPKDGGFIEHVISTASEWVLVMSFDIYILTFVVEMKKVVVSSPQIHFIFADRELHSHDFYVSEDQVAITQSNSSLRSNSAPTTPYEESIGGRSGTLVTHVIR